MPLDFHLLKPYKSYVIMEHQGVIEDPVSFNRELLTDVETFVEKNSSGHVDGRSFTRKGMTTTLGDLDVGFLHYEEEKTAAWSLDDDVTDTLQQLVVVCRKGNLVAIFYSAKGMVNKFLRKGMGDDYSVLNEIDRIPAERLTEAFISGPALTLWLSGTHRRVEVKADNKVLSGKNLRYALDPLGDQTYYFTSARCNPKDLSDGSVRVGFTPRQSKAWLGPTSEWSDFVETTNDLLDYLSAPPEDAYQSLDVLSTMCTGTVTLDSAYDIALLPPELIAGASEMSTDDRKELEKWSMLADYKVNMKAGPDVEVVASLEGSEIGTFTFRTQLDPPDVTYEIDHVAKDDDQEATCLEVEKWLRRKELLGIWYESGHTVKDGVVFQVHHKDKELHERYILWRDFTDFKVKQEKPKPLRRDNIGAQGSLFCWVKNNWWRDAEAWMACDDGAGEAADFIYFEKTDPPLLEIIHVKASHSKEQEREISVSAFEVVTSQAVKNLRYLENSELADKFRTGLNNLVGGFCWHNRNVAKKLDMIEEILAVGSNYNKRVVVFQPSITYKNWADARSGENKGKEMRFKQLNTLLNGTLASVLSVGADFKVVFDRYGRPPEPDDE